MSQRNEAEFDCPVCQIMSWARSSESVKHIRNARREMLLAVKSAVEAGIERLDKELELAPKRKAKKVDID